MVISNLLKSRIQRMEDKNDVDGLIEALYDENDSIRLEAVDALGRLRDSKAVEPLIMNLNNENKDLRCKIAASLGKIGDNRAVEPLINALSDKEDVVKEEAIVALGKIKDEKAVKYLIKMLNHNNELIKADAVTALGNIGSTKAIPSLIKLLDDKNDLIQEKAVSSLGMISINPYISKLKSDDEKIRKNAINMLKNIGKSEFEKLEPSKNVKRLQKSFLKSTDSKTEELMDEGKRIKVKKQGPIKGISTIDTVKPNISTFTDENRIFNEKKEFIISEGYYSYIENFVLRARYKCLENYVEKIKYCFYREDVDKLRDLFALKGIELDHDELNWLIQDEIKKQEYEDFKTKIEQNKPQTLKQHLKSFIKNYPHNQQQHTHHLQKLLQEKNLTKPNQNIEKQLKNTKKEIKIQEFQNSIAKSKPGIRIYENRTPNILIKFKIKDVKEKKEELVLKGSYKYLENFVKKAKKDYKIGEIRKLRDLFALKGIELDHDELNWLIQDEIKKQEYEDFKTKIEQNKPQTLKQHLKSFIKNYPHNQQQHTHHLQKLLQEKNLTKPNQNIEKQLKNTKKEIKIQEFQYYLTNPHQDVKKIEKELSEDLSFYSLKSGGKYFNLGKLFYDMDIPTESIKFFEKILETDLNNLDVLNWKGLALYRLGRSNEAANLFNKIINLNSGYFKAWINLGVILHEAGKIREAEMSYYSALKRLGKYNKRKLSLNFEIFKINPYAKSHFEYFVNLIFSNYADCGEPSNQSPIDHAIEIIKKNKYETDLE
ncbi:MAG: HEAT repeat domain-containing protein [Methanobacteriaceae archaeon]|nr:HEAT repeat domain-containing protein [Methanobacteriaceae archaeon]